MNEQYSAMRSNVSMLGKLLGDTIKDALGENILDQVETIRKLSKSSRAGNDTHRKELLNTLQNLSNEELLPVARAFSQFLNLTNVAEQYQTISQSGEGENHPELLKKTFDTLKQQKDISESDILAAIESLSLELVLTAHPTEITRRTLIHKLVEVNSCLKQLITATSPTTNVTRLCAVCVSWWHRRGTPMRSANIVRPLSTKPNGALPWWKTACGKAYPLSCVS